MSSMNKYSLYVGISLSFLSSLFSQTPSIEKADRVDLKGYLAKLEQVHGIHFSYLEDQIQDKGVAEELLTYRSLDSIITYIQIETHLKFEQLDADYFVIRSFGDSDRIFICGQVVDEKGDPLSGALIQLGQVGVAISDESGSFRLANVQYGKSVVVSYLGFDSQSTPVRELLNQYCKKIQLYPGVSVLDELVVKDYTLPGVSKVENKLVFNPERLKLLPGWIEPDIMQTIQLSPGVSAPFESATNLYIRGSTPDQNLVLWNGIKTYDQSHFFGALSAFNPSIPQKVEFSKNGASPYYGDRIAGVIAIETSDEIPEIMNGSVGLNLLSGDFYLERPLIDNKLSVSLSARRSYSDFVETPTYQAFSDRQFQNTKILFEDTTDLTDNSNRFFFHDLSASVLYKPVSNQTFRFNTLLTTNELDFQSSAPNADYRDFLHTGSDGYNFQWTKHLDSANQLFLEAYALNYGLFYEFVSIDNGAATSSEKNNLIRERGVKARVDLRLEDANKISLGYQFSHNDIRYAFNQEGNAFAVLLDQGDESLRIHTLFGDYRFRWKDISFNTGMRLNYLDSWKKFFVEPRLSLHYAITPEILIGANYEYRIQTVSQIRESVVSDLSLENQVWTLASPDGFPVLSTNQYAANVSFNKKGWLFEVEAYKRKLEGITSLTFGFLNPNPTDNEYRVGESDIDGMDLLVKKQVKDYSGMLSYSLINTENKFSGLNNDQKFPGNWNIRHMIKWAHFYQWKSWDFSLGWTWHSGKVYTESEALLDDEGVVNIEIDRINKSILPKYHRLDASATYRFLSKRNVQYKLGLSLLNVYARDNLINRELRKEPLLESDLLETEFYGLGFTPNVLFRVVW